MPKWIKLRCTILIMLVSLLMLIGCGSGDEMGVNRTSPLDLATSGTGTIGTGGGGGGTGTGACELLGGCLGEIEKSTCDFYAQYYTVDWNAGQTCPELGYTQCVTVEGPNGISMQSCI